MQLLVASMFLRVPFLNQMSTTSMCLIQSVQSANVVVVRLEMKN